MKRLRSILLTFLALLLVIPLVGIMWPEGKLDLSKDEEPFKSMVLPPMHISAGIVMDGGSVLVIMNDERGKLSVIQFYIDKERILNSHPTAAYATELNGMSIPLKNTARAKVIMIRLLRDYGIKEHEMSNMQAINGLSDPLGDFAERIYDKSKNKLRELTGF